MGRISSILLYRWIQNQKNV